MPPKILRGNHCHRRSTIAFAALVFAGSIATGAQPPDDSSWNAFWAAHHVSPPPPRDFLEAYHDGEVRNLTVGRISNETARRWVLGAERRAAGDNFAYANLRSDVANADVFGPPGLSGTSEAIDAERAKGVVHIDGLSRARTIAVGVISVSKQMQAQNPGLHLTDFVLVHLRRASGEPMTKVFKDGHRETVAARLEKDQLIWQLDTGYFVDDPVVGPLWYQADGWSCTPDDFGVPGELCGKVQP